MKKKKQIPREWWTIARVGSSHVCGRSFINQGAALNYMRELSEAWTLPLSMLEIVHQREVLKQRRRK